MLVAAVVILAGVVVVASGRGGELAASQPDYPPIDLGPVTSADVALLRPPSAAWGYNMRVTDEALEVIAQAVTQRDVQIAALEQEVADLRDQLGGGSQLGGGQLGGRAHDTLAAAPSVSATRPEPIFHADDQDGVADQVHFGPGWGGHDEAEPAPGAPAGASAPWGPAELPEDEPLWEPAHQHLDDPHPSGHAISWEAPGPGALGAEPESTATQAAPWDSGHQPAAGAPAEEAAAEEAAPEPVTAPEPVRDHAPEPPADVETSVPVTPATGWPAQDPSALDPSTQDPSAQEPAAPAQEAPASGSPASHSGPHQFLWDEDPHQRVVWGAEHARAKAARAAEETLPNPEPAHPGAEAHPDAEAPGPDGAGQPEDDRD
jgi:hypothetical protein